MNEADGRRPLEGKVALITGASRRIGASTAMGLAAQGADIAVTARTAREEDGHRQAKDSEEGTA